MKKACVVGGTGNLGSMLIKHLLQKGYAVNTTVRNPDDERKMSHLVPLQEMGDLEIFKADLTDEGSFDVAVDGCDFVFHVATPVNFDSEDPENDMIKPAIQGVMNVLKSCLNAKTVKRVIYTSSAAAVSINNMTVPGLVMDETNWTDVEFLLYVKPPSWGYPVSKTLAEKAAWKFATENQIDLISVIPVLLAGPSLLPNPPSSLSLSMSLITGNELFLESLKAMQKISGSISIVHMEDVCRAHIFLAEKETASGRYICCASNSSVPEISNFLSNRYPKYRIPTELEDVSFEAKLKLSSEKLIKEGFCFKHGLEDIYVHTLEYFESKGLVQSR